MHFIDINFKHFASSNNNDYHLQTILYGLTDTDKEITLYRYDEYFKNEQLKHKEFYANLTDENKDEIKSLLNKKNIFNSQDILIINNLVSRNKIKTRRVYE